MSAARRSPREQAVIAAYLGVETIAGICERLGIGEWSLYSIIKKSGVRKRRREYTRRKAATKNQQVRAPSVRDLAIAAERSRGETLAAIGKRHGLSKQRVAQILSASSRIVVER